MKYAPVVYAERDAANEAWNDLTVVNESNLSKYATLKADNAKLRKLRELAKGAIAGLYTSEWPCIGPENVTRISKILQQIAYGEGGGA